LHGAVLYNIGVNDFSTATQSQWIADMETTLDAIHAQWPAAIVYIAKPWKRTFDATADTFAGWIETIVAARAFARVGFDERSWLKGADNGNTMTRDGVHYSDPTGEAQAASQWQTIMGF
jgi:hypothetical protein